MNLLIAELIKSVFYLFLGKPELCQSFADRFKFKHFLYFCKIGSPVCL